MRYIDYSKRILERYESGEVLYRELLGHSVVPGYRVLHLGCGRDLSGVAAQHSRSSEIIGVDLDLSALADYPGLGCYGDAVKLPFQGASFDLVVSEYVLEHLVDPRTVFIEVSRVLRPGGRFIALCPNFWSYKSLAAHFTPLSFHRLAVRVLRGQEHRKDEDVFPTQFLASTERQLRRLSASAGLRPERLEFLNNGPTWFSRVPVIFELGRLYHALIELRFLRRLRCNILFEARRDVLNAPSQQVEG